MRSVRVRFSGGSTFLFNIYNENIAKPNFVIERRNFFKLPIPVEV